MKTCEVYKRCVFSVCAFFYYYVSSLLLALLNTHTYTVQYLFCMYRVGIFIWGKYTTHYIYLPYKRTIFIHAVSMIFQCIFTSGLTLNIHSFLYMYIASREVEYRARFKREAHFFTESRKKKTTTQHTLLCVYDLCIYVKVICV